MVVRCPELCWPADAPAAAQMFERVLAVVTRFCPGVEAVEPGVCAFGVRGPARYFGGETALARRIIAAVADLGLQTRAGVADGLFAARLAARGPGQVRVIPPGGSAEFLARHPVSVLADQDLAGLLNRLGLRTLGDLAACRSPTWPAGSAPRARPRTGWPAATVSCRWRCARRPRTCR